MTTAAKRTKKYFLNSDRRGLTVFEEACGAFEKDRHIEIHRHPDGLKRSSSVRKAIRLPIGRCRGTKSGSALLPFLHTLFNHFVGLNEQRLWNCDSERLRCLQIDI